MEDNRFPERVEEEELHELSLQQAGLDGSTELKVSENQGSTRSSKWKKELREWLLIIVIAVALGIFLRTYVVQRNLVDGSSMFPTLHDSDRVLVEMLSLRFAELQRGDIVTIDSSDLPGYEYLAASGQKGPRLIKRVIALPGDHLEIKADGVYVNGEAIFEQYVNPGSVTRVYEQEYADLILAEDSYFVMGDNREHSRDSRQFGPVHISDIVGKLWIRVYPYNQLGTVE